MRMLLVVTGPETAEKVILAARLRWPNADVHVAGQADDRLLVAEDQEPDIVIFESEAGLKPADVFVQELRGFSNVPLIVLEADGSGGDLEEVKALEAGADDYIRQPAGVISLVARMVAAVRRGGITNGARAGQPLSNGTLTLDHSTYEVYLNGGSASLTATEFRLLHLLLSNRGQVVTHEVLGRVVVGRPR